MGKKITGVWYKSKNFGDDLNVFLLEEISARKSVNLRDSIFEQIKAYFGVGKTFMAIGSIMHYSKKNSIIWGSGCIDKGEIGSTPKKVCAVRGPLTRDELLKRNVQCPEVYGDPALLLPHFYMPKVSRNIELGIVPHYSDQDSQILNNFRKDPRVKIIDVNKPWKDVVNDILSCKRIVSSSLHGLIIADTYGIPSLWIEFSNNIIGAGFKFRDYYASNEISDATPIRMTGEISFDFLLSNTTIHEIKCDLEALWEACPFKKPLIFPTFLEPDYLNRINIPSHIYDISVVIPTYNRSPFAKDSKFFRYNPLYIALESLNIQSGNIKETIIIDDCSTDHVLDVVEYFKTNRALNIHYIRNERNLGSCVSRNRGASKATGKYLLFFDDDCILSPQSVFVMNYTMEHMLNIDTDTAVIVLPVYVRRTRPTISTLLTGYKNRLFQNNTNPHFDGFPVEYTKNPEFIDDHFKILRPIQTFQTWGCFLVVREKYLDVGGFPEFFDWPGKTGEEPEFAERLTENGLNLYFQSDPKASSCHARYGSRKGPFIGKDWFYNKTGISLKRFMKICDSRRQVGSGNRISIEDSIYAAICSRIVLIKNRDNDYLSTLLRQIYDHFVIGGKRILIIKGNLEFIDERVILEKTKRNELYERAVKHAEELMIKQVRTKS